MNIIRTAAMETLTSSDQFTPVDYAIIIALLSVSLAIGLFIGMFKNGSKTVDDFLFGGFKMSFLPVALSLLAR